MHYKAYYIDRQGRRINVVETSRPTPEGDIVSPVIKAMCVARLPLGEVRVERGKALHECP